MSQNTVKSNRERATLFSAEFKDWKRAALDSGGWFPIFNGFKLFLPALSGNALRLYVYVGLHANRESGESWHSIDSIAAFFGKSPRAINDWVKELQDSGLIERFQLRPNTETHTFIRPYPAALKLVVDAVDSNSASDREQESELLSIHQTVSAVRDSEQTDPDALLDYIQALLRLAHIEAELGRVDSAMQSLGRVESVTSQAHQLNVDSCQVQLYRAEASVLIGDLLCREQNYAEGAHEYKIAVELLDKPQGFPANLSIFQSIKAKAWLQLARAHAHLTGDVDAAKTFGTAITECRQAVQLSPHSAALRYDLGRAYMELAEYLLSSAEPDTVLPYYERASREFNECLVRVPGKSEAYAAKELAKARIDQILSTDVHPMLRRSPDSTGDNRHFQGVLQLYTALADNDLIPAFLAAYQQLEAQLIRVAAPDSTLRADESNSQSYIVGVLSQMVQHERLPISTVGRYIRLRTVRNQLVHSARPIHMNLQTEIRWCIEIIRQIEAGLGIQ